ncbi:MAG: hypothetical protein ACTHJX_04180 [Terriglobales bacterium]
MKHADDKQLMAHAMGFGDQATAAHLEDCAACRQRLEGWQQPLRMAARWDSPEADALLPARVWARMDGILDSPVPQRSWRWAWSGAAALAAVLVLMGWWARPRAAAPAARAAVAESPSASPLLRAAVGEHLDQAQALLLEVKHAPAAAGTVPMADARRQARELLAANRLYAADAAAHGDLTAAHVLGLLEPPLLEIAHSPNRLDSVQWQRMQERFAASGLLFKLRVFDQTLTARRQAPTSERNGDL